MKFFNVYEIIEEQKDISGCEWLVLQDYGIDYYYQFEKTEAPVEQLFYNEICELLDEALYMVLCVTDCVPNEESQGSRLLQILNKEKFRDACIRLSEEYRQYIRQIEQHPYMTFAYLREIMKMHNISEDARLMSDSGWEYGPTDIRETFYHKEDNVVVFTQLALNGGRDYFEEKGWKEVSHKCSNKEVYFNIRRREHELKLEKGIMLTHSDLEI